MQIKENNMTKKINTEHWGLLNGYSRDFRTFIFEKDGKFFRTGFKDIQIGLEVNPSEISLLYFSIIWWFCLVCLYYFTYALFYKM